MTTKNNDDKRFEYTMSQQDKPLDDPLAAIKSMRLEQLAVCRLKTEKEMQGMKQELLSNEVEQDKTEHNKAKNDD
jgi:hypothetical protein